jgi:phenylacetate-CoA ligase
MNIDGRRALSDRLLSRTLDWARTTRAHRDLGQILSQWPILEKEELKDNEDKFRNQSLISIPSNTSGSTGIPIRLSRSLRCIAAEQAFLDSLLEPFGLTMREARIARLRADHIKPPSDREPPFGIRTNAGRWLRLSGMHLSEDTTDWYIEAINDFAPDILWILPNSIKSLARYILRNERKVRVPIILSSSEILHSPDRMMFEQAFQAKVIDYYGLAERVAFATSMEDGHYFFNPAYGLIELIPDPEHSPGLGASRAEVIATGFWNESMPLVRLRTGDLVTYPASYTEDDLAEVALGLRPFTSILGRDDYYLLSPRGEVLSELELIPHEIQGILQMQLIQESYQSVIINLLTDATFGKKERVDLDKNIREHIPDDMAVEIHVVDKLETLLSGKTPYVIRRVESLNKR